MISKSPNLSINSKSRENPKKNLSPTLNKSLTPSKTNLNQTQKILPKNIIETTQKLNVTIKPKQDSSKPAPTNRPTTLKVPLKANQSGQKIYTNIQSESLKNTKTSERFIPANKTARTTARTNSKTPNSERGLIINKSIELKSDLKEKVDLTNENNSSLSNIVKHEDYNSLENHNIIVKNSLSSDLETHQIERLSLDKLIESRRKTNPENNEFIPNEILDPLSEIDNENGKESKTKRASIEKTEEADDIFGEDNIYRRISAIQHTNPNFKNTIGQHYDDLNLETILDEEIDEPTNPKNNSKKSLFKEKTEDTEDIFEYRQKSDISNNVQTRIMLERASKSENISMKVTERKESNTSGFWDQSNSTQIHSTSKRNTTNNQNFNGKTKIYTQFQQSINSTFQKADSFVINFVQENIDKLITDLLNNLVDKATKEGDESAMLLAKYTNRNFKANLRKRPINLNTSVDNSFNNNNNTSFSKLNQSRNQNMTRESFTSPVQNRKKNSMLEKTTEVLEMMASKDINLKTLMNFVPVEKTINDQNVSFPESPIKNETDVFITNEFKIDICEAGFNHESKNIQKSSKVVNIFENVETKIDAIEEKNANNQLMISEKQNSFKLLEMTSFGRTRSPISNGFQLSHCFKFLQSNSNFVFPKKSSNLSENEKLSLKNTQSIKINYVVKNTLNYIQKKSKISFLKEKHTIKKVGLIMRQKKSPGKHNEIKSIRISSEDDISNILQNGAESPIKRTSEFRNFNANLKSTQNTRKTSTNISQNNHIITNIGDRAFSPIYTARTSLELPISFVSIFANICKKIIIYECKLEQLRDELFRENNKILDRISTQFCFKENKTVRFFSFKKFIKAIGYQISEKSLNQVTCFIKEIFNPENTPIDASEMTFLNFSKFLTPMNKVLNPNINAKINEFEAENCSEVGEMDLRFLKNIFLVFLKKLDDISKIVKQTDDAIIGLIFEGVKNDCGIIDKAKIVSVLELFSTTVQPDHVMYVLRDFRIEGNEQISKEKFYQFFKMKTWLQ